MPPAKKKLCFVTIGATASFDALIAAALSPLFLEALKAAQYTDLLLQHGLEGRKVLNAFQAATSSSNEKIHGLEIRGFDFNKSGLGAEMRAAKGLDGGLEGVVISHAGRFLFLWDAGSQNLTCCNRLGVYTRRPPHRCPSDRRAEHSASGQSSSRAS